MKKEGPVQKRMVVVSRSALRTARERDVFVDDSPPAATPRTIKKLVNVRTSARSHTLELKGVDASKYIKYPKKIESPRKEKKKKTIDI